MGSPEEKDKPSTTLPGTPIKTHSAWLPGSGLVQIAVSSMLRLDYPPSTQLYLWSTVDTALQICTTDLSSTIPSNRPCFGQVLAFLTVPKGPCDLLT